jgi:hypothetical protein
LVSSQLNVHNKSQPNLPGKQTASNFLTIPVDKKVTREKQTDINNRRPLQFYEKIILIDLTMQQLPSPLPLLLFVSSIILTTAPDCSYAEGSASIIIENVTIIDKLGEPTMRK